MHMFKIQIDTLYENSSFPGENELNVVGRTKICFIHVKQIMLLLELFAFD